MTILLVLIAILAGLVTILSTAAAVGAKAISAKRARLQLAYESEQAAIEARCLNENGALFEGDLLKGLYGHFPPAPEFRPLDTRPPKPVKSQLHCPHHEVWHQADIQCPHCHIADMKRQAYYAYPPVVRCGKHDISYVSDSKCIQCLGERCRSGAEIKPPCSCNIGRQCYACAPVEVGNSEYWMEKRRQATPCLSCGKAVPASGSRLCVGCNVPATKRGTQGQMLVLGSLYGGSLGRDIYATEIAIPTVWDEKTQAVLPDVSKVVHDFGGQANCLNT